MFTRRSHARPGIALGFLAVAILVSALSAAPAAPTAFRAGTPTPVGRWRMDEGTGSTTADASGNGNTATLVGGVSWTTGQFWGGLSFNGSSGYLTAADASSLNMGTGSFTVAAWVNPATTGSPHPKGMVDRGELSIHITEYSLDLRTTLPPERNSKVDEEDIPF